MSKPIDYNSLIRPVTVDEIKDNNGWPRFLINLALTSTNKLMIGMGIVVLIIMGISIVNDLPIILMLSIFYLILLSTASWLHHSVKEIVKALKLSGFAGANKFKYIGATTGVDLNGMIFDEGHSRYGTDQIAGSLSNIPFRLGNYTYTTGGGKSSETHEYGYLRIALSRRLPHMILDAKSNNFLMFSNLPDLFSRDQRLELEGDFNNHFQLFCPKEYERDALYIFTPDLMALLIDKAGAYDVEVVDNYVYIYSSKHLDIFDPGQLQKLFHIVENIGQKFEGQSDYYKDERVASREANIVAAPGRRLKKSMLGTIFVTLVIIYIVATYIWPFLFFQP